jgi:homoserine kinase type II
MTRDLICLLCPNGCHLTCGEGPDKTLRVEGNRCEKGLAFVKSVLQGDQLKKVKVVSAQARPRYGDEVLREIAAFWGVSFRKPLPHLMPEGSPERTVFRIVIEDESARRFVLEQIPPSSFHAKMKIIKTLEFFSTRSLARVVPYLADAQGEFIKTYKEGFWQIVPFSPGVALERSTYLYEAWRADVLAGFLVGLREKSQGIPFFAYDEVFSIKKYVHTLTAQIQRREPKIFPAVKAVVAFLERDFMNAYDTLPVAFCHGDYHPLNIVWAKDDIQAVIDWEFSGMKPEIYDAANMIGCLGMEHPSSLTADLVVNFTGKLKEAGIFSPVSWEYLVEFVVAMRFAWLSEWLRKDDREMIALELDYMELLINNRDDLRAAWRVAA